MRRGAPVLASVVRNGLGGGPPLGCVGVVLVIVSAHTRRRRYVRDGRPACNRPAPTTIKIDMSLSGSVDQIRQFWSLGHLWTARNAAKRCGEIEATIAMQTIVNREHQSLAVTAVFFAAAFMEAQVNEVLLCVADPAPGGPDAIVAGIPPSAEPALAGIWNNERRKGIRRKYQESLAAVGKSEFAENRDPFKSADLVIQLRDRFVHYKPHWQYLDAQPPAAKRAALNEQRHFERALKARIIENAQPFVRPWFPAKAIGAGCANWACDASVYFVRRWRQRMSLDGRI